MSLASFSQRLFERQEATGHDDTSPALTDRDTQNVRAFGRAVDDLIQVIDEESAVVSNCDLTANEEIHLRKQRLVQQLDRLASMLEPFLPAIIKRDTELQDRITQLAAKVDENATLLERMAKAASKIATEQARILERHSLNGLYAKSGKKLDTSHPKRAAIDEQH